MGDHRKPTLPADVRDEAIAQLERYLASESRLQDACIKASKRSRIKWYRQLLRELKRYASYEVNDDIQYAVKASPHHPQWSEAATKRAILFLQSDRQYDDNTGPIKKTLRCAYALTLVSSFVVFFASGIYWDWLDGGAMAGRLFEYSAIACAICMAPLALFEAGEILRDLKYVFRVRVLRQAIRPKAAQDIWPYRDRRDYELDLMNATS